MYICVIKIVSTVVKGIFFRFYQILPRFIITSQCHLRLNISNELFISMKCNYFSLIDVSFWKARFELCGLTWTRPHVMVLKCT